MEEQQEPQRGQSIIVVAIAMFALVIFVAISIDIGSAYVGRRTAQNAADGAALAGAARLSLQINSEVFVDAEVKADMNDFGERNGVADTGGVLGDVTNANVAGWYLDEDMDRLGLVGTGAVPADSWGIEAVTYITTPAFLGGVVGYSGYPVQASAIVMLQKSCGASCVVPIATHIDTITTTPGCMNIFNGDGPGNFGWLNWSLQGMYCSSNDCSTPCLEDNLTPGSCRSGPIAFGEYVSGSPGDMNSGLVRKVLKYYIDAPEEFTVVVYDTTQQAGGCNQAYHAVGFARMQLLGFKLAQGGGNAYGHDGTGCTPMGLEPGLDPNDGVRLTAEFRGWVGGEPGNCKAIGTVRSRRIVK